VLSAPPIRALDDRDLPVVRGVLDADPVANVAVASRVDVAGLDRRRLGAELYGWPSTGPPQALLWSGANLIPVGADASYGGAAVDAFARAAAARPRMCSSVVGPRGAVLALWARLERYWGPARDIRQYQPLMVADRPADRVLPDLAVRRAVTADVEALMPACVAMYTEEVGVSPLVGGCADAYRARVVDLVRSGRTYLRLHRGRVVFKAEIGAVSPYVCQVQGVWVAPPWRGRGLGTAGMAAVLSDALRTVAPTVSLYVNDYNTPARRAYVRCGFREVGEFATVLF
jgi:predicted GNAT family acetyltransferase